MGVSLTSYIGCKITAASGANKEAAPFTDASRGSLRTLEVSGTPKQLLDGVLCAAGTAGDGVTPGPLPGPTGLDLEFARTLLRHHGDPGLCRHGESGGMHTEYSVIGLPAQSRVLFLQGHPCRGEFGELVL